MIGSCRNAELGKRTTAAFTQVPSLRKRKEDNAWPKYSSGISRSFAAELGERILEMYPPLHKPEDPVSPRMRTLLRRPYPAQQVVAMAIVRRWQEARAAAAVIGECGTGKTLIALACHSLPFRRPALVGLGAGSGSSHSQDGSRGFSDDPKNQSFLHRRLARPSAGGSSYGSQRS